MTIASLHNKLSAPSGDHVYETLFPNWLILKKNDYHKDLKSNPETLLVIYI